MQARRLYILLFLSSMVVSSQAQLCTGSLGDPTVRITFGSGSNPGSPLSTTNYAFSSGSCPNDGFYTIANSTSGCFGNTWHSLAEDHTPGDANGYFMLINASYTPGDFYVDTVKSLCEGTTYEFAAWVVNVLKTSACGFNGIKPNLTFNIETTNKTVLATYNSGDIPTSASPEWKQYGLFFTTPVGVSTVVIRLTNNAPGGCGNDLALDDITFRPCGPTVTALIQQTGSSQVDICEGNSQVFTFTSTVGSGYNNPVYQWQLSMDSGTNWNNISGATVTTYNRQPTGPGKFSYRIAVAEAANANNASCRTSSNIIMVNVNKLPSPNASSNSPVCEGQVLTLMAGDGMQYAWTGPANFSGSKANEQINNVGFVQAGKYYVLVTSEKGCVNRDSLSVLVNAIPVALAGNDATICEGNTIPLQATGGISYHWSPSSGLSASNIPNPLANPTDTITYAVMVTNAAGCTDADSVTIFVLKKPIANAGPDRKIMEGQSVALDGKSGGTNTSFFWTPVSYLSNPASLQPLASPPSDMVYTLHVVSNAGCGTAEDNAFIRVFKKVTVPNAFSPNGDGINDEWKIINLDTYAESLTEVFNRYGVLVFRSNGYSKPWDGRIGGKPLPVGVYYYIIDLKNDFPLLSGSLTVIR